jgi:hypothetical protein
LNSKRLTTFWFSIQNDENLTSSDWAKKQSYFEFGAEILVVGYWNNNLSILLSGNLIESKKINVDDFPGNLQASDSSIALNNTLTFFLTFQLKKTCLSYRAFVVQALWDYQTIEHIVNHHSLFQLKFKSKHFLNYQFHHTGLNSVWLWPPWKIWAFFRKIYLKTAGF